MNFYSEPNETIYEGIKVHYADGITQGQAEAVSRSYINMYKREGLTFRTDQQFYVGPSGVLYVD